MAKRRTVCFDNAFFALTGHQPFAWQKRLYDQLAHGEIPSVCRIPTGLGKTSVIPIWLIALAHSTSTDYGRPPLARRLVYIVNRRTVVDQATDEAKHLLGHIYRSGQRDGLTWATDEAIAARGLNAEPPLPDKHAPAVAAICEALAGLSGDHTSAPLAISTLRGELADNEEWKADPARPAIIVGTIDMIGSKLLFSGYGDGRYGRTYHAGLIGQDALIVHDEAHLTPAFSELLRCITDEQKRANESRPVHVVELSATQRGSDGNAFQLSPEDETDEKTGRLVKQRLDAKKWLRLHQCNGGVVAGLVGKAKANADTPAKVLIYVRLPEDAQKVADAIRKELGDGAEGRVALLTGTIRGHERDRLVSDNPVYRALLGYETDLKHSVFLVSTSAGEVGIDIDADQMVCDQTTLDSLIQRLGRVNRRGGADREAHVDVVWTEKDAKGGDKPLEKAIAATLGVLQKWVETNAGAGDSHPHPHPGTLVSPRNLRTLLERLSEQGREAAFSPKPKIPPLTDILLDNWSLTSIDDMPGRPEVAAYLHGLTADPPMTYVAWRKEVTLFENLAPNRDGLSAEGFREAQNRFNVTLSDWFRACRIESRERLRDRTDRVKKGLDALLKAHRKKDSERDFPVVLLNERGAAEWARLSEVSADERKLRYRTVVLPTEAVGLDEHGMLDGKATEPIGDIDVAEVTEKERRRERRRERWLDVRTAGVESQWRRLLTDELAERPSELRERERIPLKEPEEGGEDEGESTYLVLLELPAESALENPEAARVQQTLDEHTDAIVKRMEAIACCLRPEQTIKDALVSAARWHDRGKDRTVWQRFARNHPPDTEPLAKSTHYLNGRYLGGYRHEFGSLLEAMTDESLRNHPERDLVLHLIAAHHGWARPHFEHRAYDHEGPRGLEEGERRAPSTADNEAAAVEAMQRFGRLQQRFGRWGLAWLESLLRCADIAASKQDATGTPEGRPVAALQETGADS